MDPTGSSFVVALDACVLFGYPLRDTLLLSVEAELYRPAWSQEVWDEVARNLQDPRRRNPHTPEAAQRLMIAIRRSFPDAFVEGYQAPTAAMPAAIHEKDRHVAAMAVRAGAQVLVTYNTKHFPAQALAPYEIEVQHPDEFLHNLYERAPEVLVEVVRSQAALLKHPPRTVEDVLDDLEGMRLTRFARAIRAISAKMEQQQEVPVV